MLIEIKALTQNSSILLTVLSAIWGPLTAVLNLNESRWSFCRVCMSFSHYEQQMIGFSAWCMADVF